MALSVKNILPQQHHVQNEVCVTRPKYRQGRKETAVKVYTISQESKYLLIIGVPSVGAKDDLRHLCSSYGTVTSLYPLDDYPSEPFTETYLMAYDRLQSARVAKRKLDTRSFFGSSLHVCYAPEFETVEETRSKLIERQKYASMRTKSGPCGPWDTRHHENIKKNVPTFNASTSSIDDSSAAESMEGTYIWAGKTYKLSDLAPQSSTTTGHELTCEDNGVHSGNRVETRVTDFVPRQLKRTLEYRGNSPKSNSVGGGNSGSSMDMVSVNIRDKLSRLSVPNPDIVFKRKKSS